MDLGDFYAAALVETGEISRSPDASSAAMETEPVVVVDLSGTLVYDAVVREMIADADTIAAASPEDRKYMEALGFNFEAFEASRGELDKQRTHAAPVDPAIALAAAKRVAGVAPPKVEPLPEMSGSLAKVYTAALRCRNVILDGLNAN